ncbi:MAG: HD domain-containing protein [Bdellovibrio sp.]|nr:HD domain-containing protein [Bdellovibrio sp.]
MDLSENQNNQSPTLTPGDDLLIVIADPQLQRVVKVSFDLSCNNTVHLYKTTSEALSFLNTHLKEVKAIIVTLEKNDYNFNDILEKVHKSLPKITVVIITSSEKETADHKLARLPYIHFYSKDNFLRNFSQIMVKDLGLNIPQSDDHYIKIEIETLSFVDGLEKDVFMKDQATGHYSSLFRRGSILAKDEIAIYKSKGLSHVYIEKDILKEILPQIDAQRSIFATYAGFKFVVRSEDDPLDKRFEQKIMRFQDEIIIDGEFQQQIENAVEKTLSYLQKKPNSIKLLKHLSGLRSSERFLPEHMILLCFISSAWAHKLGWYSQGTKDKLVFASILHDITLAARPHLAKIRTLAEFNSQRLTLSDKDQELFLNHPEECSRLVAQHFKEAPHDTADIILQHHERPDGSGFPNKINFTKMSPLSMLFILAHDFVENFIFQDNYSLKIFLREAQERYPQQNFKKMLKTIGGEGPVDGNYI